MKTPCNLQVNMLRMSPRCLEDYLCGDLFLSTFTHYMMNVRIWPVNSIPDKYYHQVEGSRWLPILELMTSRSPFLFLLCSCLIRYYPVFNSHKKGNILEYVYHFEIMETLQFILIWIPDSTNKYKIYTEMHAQSLTFKVLCEKNLARREKNKVRTSA